VTDVDGLNSGFARDLLEDYLENPDAVPSEWRELFESGRSDVVATHPGLVRLLDDGAAATVEGGQVWRSADSFFSAA